MKIFAYILILLLTGVNTLFCERFDEAQVVSINTNTVSARFENGKIYRVINTSEPVSVLLRKNFSGKWKRKRIKGARAIRLLIRRGYFVEIENNGLTYFAATKSYRTLADPPHKYNRSSKLQPTFNYYYPVSVVSRDALPGNDIRHYNYYSPSRDRWHTVPYYNSGYPWFRDSILTDPNRSRSSRYYSPGHYGHPYVGW